MLGVEVGLDAESIRSHTMQCSIPLIKINVPSPTLDVSKPPPPTNSTTPGGKDSGTPLLLSDEVMLEVNDSSAPFAPQLCAPSHLGSSMVASGGSGAKRKQLAAGKDGPGKPRHAPIMMKQLRDALISVAPAPSTASARPHPVPVAPPAPITTVNSHQPAMTAPSTSSARPLAAVPVKIGNSQGQVKQHKQKSRSRKGELHNAFKSVQPILGAGSSTVNGLTLSSPKKCLFVAKLESSTTIEAISEHMLRNFGDSAKDVQFHKLEKRSRNGEYIEYAFLTRMISSAWLYA